MHEEQHHHGLGEAAAAVGAGTHAALGAIEFRNRLMALLGDAVELPDTLLFDFPTLRRLQAYLSPIHFLNIFAAFCWIPMNSYC